MARDITTIYDSLISEKESHAELDALVPNPDTAQTFLDNLSTPSNVGVWRHIFWLVSVALWVHETIFDRHKAEVTALIDSTFVGTARWFQREALKFQNGLSLLWINDSYLYAGIVTLTGTGGTANITIQGVDYLATYNTSLTQSAADFVILHSNALFKRGIIVQSSGAAIQIAKHSGTISISNVTTDLNGTITQPLDSQLLVKRAAVQEFSGQVRFKVAKVPTVDVKQKDTVSLTAGTDGDINIIIDGVLYTETYATSLTDTAAAFVTSHAATILSVHGVVATSSVQDIILEANVAGVPFLTAFFTTLTMTATLANTTVNETIGLPAPLDTTELASFSSYIEGIKIAGQNIAIKTAIPDRLKIYYDITYDPKVLTSTGESISTPDTFPVHDKIVSFVGNLRFDGVLNLTALTDALQEVSGVVDPKLISASGTFGDLPYSAIDKNYIADAGHMIIDTSFPLNSTITYTKDV